MDEKMNALLQTEIYIFPKTIDEKWYHWTQDKRYMAKTYMDSSTKEKFVVLESDRRNLDVSIKKFKKFLDDKKAIKESENECQYCYNTENQFRNTPLFDGYGMSCLVFRNELRVSYEDSYAGEQNEDIEINFCPKCGKKLEKYREEDEFEV